MAVSNVHNQELVAALIDALKDPGVVKTLISAIRDDVKKSFEKELEERDQKIAELENKIDDLEMYGRRNGIRIHGIPENEGEKTDEIVIKLAQDMGANIPSSALGRSHRVGRKNNNRPRAIIAKFVGHNHKVAYLKQKQELKKLPEDKPDVYVNDVFVNEDLISKRAGMAKHARLMRKAKRISDTWTRDGVIFIKLKDGTIDSFTRDISKAFDRVWHRGLLFKLRLMGLSGTLLSWFSSYLDNRHQRVAVEGSLSDILQFKAGVPQGSILGPLLFLICINDIVEEIGSCIRLFAR